MSDFPNHTHQIQTVTNFEDLLSTPFQGSINAACWTRQLKGNFSEIANKLPLNENIETISQEQLHGLQLSDAGQLARSVIVHDFELLTAHGAAPTLNLIQHYDRDDSYPFFPTDVYSFHVDRSAGAMNTFLCTYHGAPSDILPNAQAEQKVLIPEIRAELKKLYDGSEDDFNAFLEDYFFDLHYDALPYAQPISLGTGHLWRLAVDHPDSDVPPCIHRAPLEEDGKLRLMIIC